MYDIFSESCPVAAGIPSWIPEAHARTPTIIIDRCPLFREGLKDFLEDSPFEVVSSMANLKDVHLPVQDFKSRVLVVHAASGNLADNITALSFARTKFPHATVVLLYNNCQPQHAAVLFSSGVSAILSDPSQNESFIKALELAMLGQYVVPFQLMKHCFGFDAIEFKASLPHVSPKNSDKVGTKFFRLSRREVEIVQCLLGGEPNRLIAQRLMISEATVKVHVKAILRKINAKNRTQAAIWAANNVGLQNAFDSPTADVFSGLMI